MTTPPIHAADNQHAALLQKLCDPDNPERATPFGIVIGYAPATRWDAATNGHLVLAFDTGTCDRRDPISQKAERLIADAPTPTHTCTLAALREWAGTDDGIYRECGGGGWSRDATTCDECDGEGVVYCNYDHEHDCPMCGGTGKKGDKCGACGGRKERNIDAAWIGDCPVNRCLLASVIHDLPGNDVQISWSAEKTLNTVAVYGPGWRLIVAGLHMHMHMPADVPRLALTPIEETAP
jgi:hypothetical protein